MEENSPVDCFRRRANEQSEAIEAAASAKSLTLRQKKAFIKNMYNKKQTTVWDALSVF